MGCSPSILSSLSNNNNNRKDSGLYCSNNSDTNSNKIDAHNETNTALANQILVQSSNKDALDKDCVKKDSIVSVSGFGHITHNFTIIPSSIRRATIGTSAPSNSRLGHRKSSLALTPEEDCPVEPTIKLHDGKYPYLIPPNPPVRALIVFHKDDQVSDAVLRSCERLNLEITRAKSTDSALELFQSPLNGGHHLVIVDGRCKNTDVESFGRSLRSSKGSQYTIMVCVVKKSVFEKDDTSILSLLDVGYNRCIIESPHVSILSSELRQIQHSLIRPQNVIATQQALYAALHRVKDTVMITDDALRIQYMNKQAERILGMKIDEVVGRPLHDFINSDASVLLSQTNRLREFDGTLSFTRKVQDPILLHVRAYPVACLGKSTTHLILSIQGSGSHEMGLPSIPQAKEPRGSLHSIRRGSFDIRSIASDGLRRTSLAKLSSLPLEAPITKVLSLLTQVQENCSTDEARLLDRVMDFLKREGLYSPQIKEIRPEDPVATDLIGALLTQGPTNVVSSRRSSNESIIRSGSRQSSTSAAVPKMKMPTHVTELLECALDWDFEIFRLEELTEKHPLVYLGTELFRRFDVYNTFNCDEVTFRSWLIVIESHYHNVNTYHNSTHAADVMQATACYLQQLANRDLKIMDRLDEATALIASAAHDVDHPGRSSAYLCNSDNQLAILYNDVCVLESHHAATTFRLTLSDEKINIFKNLDRDMYKLARSIIIDMILATEMTRHFEHLAKFVSVFGNDAENRDIVIKKYPLKLPNDEDNQMLIRRMLIKCSDVSNPTRPLKFCVEWARRIAEEYFIQTDEEKRKGMPIVMPMFDRATCSISKSQIGFIEFIIQDMMNAWDGFIDMPELVQYMQYNYTQWKLFEEQGINTLNDIKRKQMSITNANLSSMKLDEMM
ncbi:high affinity cAMP-specific and IBMX-insensitive 3',5'-cyclic phosphodiesterase 8 isoform X5 [Chironomus tepperi]|uniref:high affinity cAMP-specific and IBMX-insensitive 3',5'-cyclic phosphodiesterase 8 isoform X5 n=1 Tax=Chironomus tepperi TaxID=113505 RepID=UPI00391FC3FB